MIRQIADTTLLKPGDVVAVNLSLVEPPFIRSNTESLKASIQYRVSENADVVAVFPLGAQDVLKWRDWYQVNLKMRSPLTAGTVKTLVTAGAEEAETGAGFWPKVETIGYLHEEFSFSPSLPTTISLAAISVIALAVMVIVWKLG